MLHLLMLQGDPSLFTRIIFQSLTSRKGNSLYDSQQNSCVSISMKQSKKFLEKCYATITSHTIHYVLHEKATITESFVFKKMRCPAKKILSKILRTSVCKNCNTQCFQRNYFIEHLGTSASELTQVKRQKKCVKVSFISKEIWLFFQRSISNDYTYFNLFSLVRRLYYMHHENNCEELKPTCIMRMIVKSLSLGPSSRRCVI